MRQPMRRLSALDAQFLNIESGGTVAHIAGLAILDASTTPGGALTLEDLLGLVRRTLPRIEQFRWRLAEVRRADAHSPTTAAWTSA
jgi:diacylglycerol O-acyltransferase